MPAIEVSTGPAATITVERRSTLLSAQPSTSVIAVPASTAVATQDGATATLDVAAPGPRGPAAPAIGDNDTFDTNLAMLYSISKA